MTMTDSEASAVSVGMSATKVEAMSARWEAAAAPESRAAGTSPIAAFRGMDCDAQ